MSLHILQPVNDLAHPAHDAIELMAQIHQTGQQLADLVGFSLLTAVVPTEDETGIKQMLLDALAAAAIREEVMGDMIDDAEEEVDELTGQIDDVTAQVQDIRDEVGRINAEAEAAIAALNGSLL
jgi:hypothetical protein